MASSHALWRVIIFLTGSRSDCTRGVHDILQYRVVNVSSSLLNTLKNTNFRLFSSYHLNAHFLYSITIYMLNHNPQHVSSSILLIFRRTNCIITASGIVTLCKVPYSTPVESGISTGVLYGCLQTVTIPDAVIIQFVLLKLSKVLLETCRGL